MIPTIEQILEDYKNGVIDLNQALSWIDQHMINDDLRDMFAAKAPPPSESYIATELGRDRGKNPYNESHKPPLRSSLEILCQWNYEYADAMIAERNKA